MMRCIIALCMIVAMPSGAAATWTSQSSAAFTGYARGSPTLLAADLRRLQDFDALLRLVTGAAPAESTARLPIFFINSSEIKDFGLSNSRVDGFYSSGPGLTAAFLAVDRARGDDPLTVLFHEYTHHFMFASGRATYPPWYVEGLAEYLSTARLARGEARVGDVSPGRAYRLLRGDWLPLHRVLTSRIADLKRDEIGQFYAQSWLLVHYLTRDDDRRARMKTYLTALNRGTPSDAAFEAAFGIDDKAMEARLHVYLASREITLSRFGFAGAASDTLTAPVTLPRAADALLLPSLRLAKLPFRWHAGADVAASETALLDEVRGTAARFPGDAFGETVRCEAEIKLGDRAAGVAALDIALAAHPDDPQLLYLRGAALLADALDAARAGRDPRETMREARVALTRANRFRPDDYRILTAHARTYRLSDLPPAEVEVLLRATELAPQIAATAILAARAVLAQRRDAALAKLLLAPIANNPHGGSEAATATRLIAAIDRDAALPADTGVAD